MSEELTEISYSNENKVATITLNRPKALNALNKEMLVAIQEALQTLLSKQSVQVVVITGAGEKAFVAGADIAAMADLNSAGIAEYLKLGLTTMEMISTYKVPVIAAVNGFALGGGMELALACDIIIASESARLGLPEVSLGIIPGFGGTQRLVQRAGIGTAKNLILSGKMITARQACDLQIVQKVVPDAELMDCVFELAESILSKGPLAISMAKQVINGHGEEILHSGLKTETQAFIDLFDTADRLEGMQAFLEKRAAKFTAK